jgi:hypothetical protein
LKSPVQKIRIFFEYLAASLIIFLLLSVIASVVVAKFYGNEIKEHATELINENIDTQFSIDEIGISILKNFPNISLYFSGVTVWSASSFNTADFGYVPYDTLLTAERIYIRFNLPNLLRKKLSISSMEARDGLIRILIDKSGKGNFLIADREREKSRLVEMKGVTVRNFGFQYINIAKDMTANGTIREMFLEGNFFDQQYTLKSGGTAYIDRITNHGVTYLNKQEIKTDLAIKVDRGQYTISKGELMLGELTAGITGNFQLDMGRGAELDLQLTGKKIDVEWITGILTSSKKFPEGISGKGKFDMSVGISGLFSATLTPQIDAMYSSNNMSLELQKAGLKFRSITLNGDYTNGTLKSAVSSVAHVHAIRAATESSNVSGSIKIHNFISPLYEITLLGNIKASELAPLIKNWPIIPGEGRIKPKLIFKGTAKREGGTIGKISLNPFGEIEFDNLQVGIEQMNIDFSKLNGSLNILPNRWETKIQGYMNQADFMVNLSAIDPVNVITGVSATEIEGTVYSSNLNIDQLFTGRANEESEEGSMAYPKKISANIKFQFDKITKGLIQSGKVSGNMIYRYPELYIDPVHAETMNGIINSSIALIDLHKPVHKLSVNSSFKNVDINEVFQSFNNFGQEFLTHKNIAGSISGDSEFFTPLNNDFSINPSEIVSESSFVIENGELIDFQPLVELSKFLKIDRMDHIHFSNLSNTILINNSNITIPQMDISSSALNLHASGTHGFNRKYKYHLATKLSEIMFNKARSIHDAEFEIALDNNDRRTIFLVLYDDGDGMNVEFDEAQAMKKIRNDLKNEKTVLKEVLNQEFGVFKEDISLQQRTKTSKGPILEFDFSPADTTTSAEENKPEKPRWWKRKDQENKKPVLDFVIDDSDL